MPIKLNREIIIKSDAKYEIDITASDFLNDVDGSMCFAQQVYGYGNAGDVLLTISTSGNSSNILYAAITAKAKGMKVVGLTGRLVPVWQEYMFVLKNVVLYH